MTLDNQAPPDEIEETPDARSGASLVPMLIAGLVLTILGYSVLMAFF